mgnify:FL=1
MKLVVNKNSELLEYLYENLDMPKKRIKQYLVHGAIYVEEDRVTQYNYPLVAGMKIMIDTNSKHVRKLPFEILFEDDHLLVVNKPSGLLTIATDKEKERTLYHIVRDYVISKNPNGRIFIVHRLDKDTSGIVLFAKDEKTKNQLQENWNEYVSLREYTAIVFGHPKEESGQVVQYLKETKTNLVYVSRHEDGKKAITNYSLIKSSDNYSMLKVTIETGRKNQIRVALASKKMPIVGDKKYGDSRSKANRLYLHANRLKIYYPVIKKEILFETAIPNEFKKLLSQDR